MLLSVLIWYSVYSIGDRPWEVEEILAHPGEYEEEEVVFSHTIREFETGDVMEVAFSRDDMRLWVPLEFNHEPELEVGGVLTLKGVCRIQSRGVIVVLDYHVADTGFKVVLGGLGLVIMIGYFLRRYRLNTGQVSWERREDA